MARTKENNSLATLGLFAATAFWGASFFIVKTTVAEVGLWPFLFWRFALTVVIMAILFPRKYLRPSRSTVKAGGILGFFLFMTLWTQTFGLQYTTAGKSGFLTSLYVPFVPILGWLFFRIKIHYRHVLVASVAVLGLYVLTDPARGQALTLREWWGQLNVGDVWTVGTAVVAAFHILYTEKLSRRENDSFALGMWQFLLCFVFVSMGVGIAGWKTVGQWNILHWSPMALMALIFEAAVATCFSFMMQIICQKRIGSLKAALIFALEAPFASFFAFLFINERLSSKEFIGAALVFLVSIVPDKWLKGKREMFRGAL